MRKTSTVWHPVALLVLLTVASGRAHAVPTIRLHSNRAAVLADGRDSTQVSAEVRDTTGRPAADGTTVTFTTSLGTFQRAGTSVTAATQAGSARVVLSSPTKGVATVTAASTGGGFQRTEVVFTDDPSETFQGNAFVSVTGDSALVYAAGERAIEAIGKPRKDPEKEAPGARLRYRSVEITADAILLDCKTNLVRAEGNVTLRRGARKLKCLRLSYPLMAGPGYAIADVNGRWRPVDVSGMDLSTQVRGEPVPPSAFARESLADARQLISAKQILLFPGDKLQFKRPRFFQDRQPLVSLPFYSLALYSNQLFSDQFVSVGSQGLGINLPLYYDLTPGSTGLFRLRSGERYGTSASAIRPGLALDITQTYASLGAGSRYTGDIGLTDVNRSDWGFRFTHNQEFSSATRGTLTFEVPQHRSVYASTNLHQQFGGMRGGLNLYGSRSLRGLSSTTSQGDVYLETNTRRLGGTGYQYALGATASTSRSVFAGTGMSTSTQGMQMRAYSRPLRLDPSTTLSHTWSVGQAWSTGGSRTGATFLSSLSASRALGSLGNLQVTYDFTRLPTRYVDSGQHRISSNLYIGAGSKFSMYLYGSVLLDAPYRSLTGDARYNFARRWNVGVAANYQSMSALSYQDLEFSISRSVGLRDLSLTYSTLNHRVYFDLLASRF